ncbi:MAG: transglycosylase SLT domain-containing protein [Candidatus Eremiobacteraeota bacterium]|nr:transglycosylase SLT domain-containing protein [Candidatus Eremiobacteraeota bacterium]
MSLDPIAGKLAANGVAFAPEIAGAARRHGLDPALLAAVAAQETGGPGSNAGRNVVGDGGHGHGVFQIDDRWHAFAGSAAAMDPARNADYAAGMLSGLLGEYGGNVREALSAYNSGSPHAIGTRTRWGDGTDLGYADSVLRHYRRLTLHGLEEPATSSATAENVANVASVGQLHERAQQLPQPSLQAPSLQLSMAAPSLSSAHSHPYQRASTDYMQLATDADETNSLE